MPEDRCGTDKPQLPNAKLSLVRVRAPAATIPAGSSDRGRGLPDDSAGRPGGGDDRRRRPGTPLPPRPALQRAALAAGGPGDTAEAQRIEGSNLRALDAGWRRTCARIVQAMDAQIGRALDALDPTMLPEIDDSFTEGITAAAQARFVGARPAGRSADHDEEMARRSGARMRRPSTMRLPGSNRGAMLTAPPFRPIGG